MNTLLLRQSLGLVYGIDWGEVALERYTYSFENLVGGG